MKTPLTIHNIPFVTNKRGDKLLTNDRRPEAREWFEKAKAETGAPVIIGQPGGKYASSACVGLWVKAEDHNKDLSAFWRAYERIRQ